MPLQPGTTLGPYEVVAEIGRGGMGDVYQPRDPGTIRLPASTCCSGALRTERAA